MLRQEGKRRFETTYEVTAFEPGRLIAFTHDDGGMGFALRFELSPADDRATDFTVSVDMQPHGLFRLATPLIGYKLPHRTDRIARRMVALVEGRTDAEAIVSRPEAVGASVG